MWMRAGSLGVVVTLIVGLLVGLLVGVAPSRAAASGAEPLGYQVMTLWSGGGSLPVVLRRDDALHATLINGDERIALTFAPDLPTGVEPPAAPGLGPLVAWVQPYGTKIRINAADGPLAGTTGQCTIERASGPAVVDFNLDPISSPAGRFTPMDSMFRAGDFAGRWAVDFASDDAPAIGVFEVDPASGLATGTFLTTTGDYRFLRRGARVSVSRAAAGGRHARGRFLVGHVAPRDVDGRSR